MYDNFSKFFIDLYLQDFSDDWFHQSTSERLFYMANDSNAFKIRSEAQKLNFSGERVLYPAGC